MRNGARDTKLCVLSQLDAEPTQDLLTKVSRSSLTASAVKFPPAITFAQSVVELPTSSRTLTAAWEIVCEAGLPDTWEATARRCWKAFEILRMCEGRERTTARGARWA
jgi:hypothetical protein